MTGAVDLKHFTLDEVLSDPHLKAILFHGECLILHSVINTPFVKSRLRVQFMNLTQHFFVFLLSIYII